MYDLCGVLDRRVRVEELRECARGEERSLGWINRVVVIRPVRDASLALSAFAGEEIVEDGLLAS
jgi:hypothetical protein